MGPNGAKGTQRDQRDGAEERLWGGNGAMGGEMGLWEGGNEAMGGERGYRGNGAIGVGNGSRRQGNGDM